VCGLKGVQGSRMAAEFVCQCCGLG
jgi:hypothetical protein